MSAAPKTRFIIPNTKYFIAADRYGYSIWSQEQNKSNKSGYQDRFHLQYTELDNLFLLLPKHFRPFAEKEKVLAWVDAHEANARIRIQKARKALGASVGDTIRKKLNPEGESVVGTNIIIKPNVSSGFLIIKRADKDFGWHFAKLDNLLMSIPKLLTEQGSLDGENLWDWANIKDAVTQYEKCCDWVMRFCEVRLAGRS